MLGSGIENCRSFSKGLIVKDLHFAFCFQVPRPGSSCKTSPVLKSQDLQQKHLLTTKNLLLICSFEYVFKNQLQYSNTSIAARSERRKGRIFKSRDDLKGNKIRTIKLGR
jgi:hypothetical protein